MVHAAGDEEVIRVVQQAMHTAAFKLAGCVEAADGQQELSSMQGLSSSIVLGSMDVVPDR